MGACASNNLKAPHEKRFKRAIKLYEVTEVKSLTNLLNRNKCFESGESPLTLAAKEGHEAIVQTLVSSGADVNKLDKNGRGPLHVAVQLHDDETVAILIAANANPNKYDDENQTPLHVASEKGYTELARSLIDAGANVNENKKGLPPLALSVVHGHAECVELLLKNGAQPDVCDARGNTVLHVAIANGDELSTKYLLDYKADIHAPSRDDTTLLCLGCLTGSPGITQLLVNAEGSDVNLHRQEEPPPLVAATVAGNADCLDALIAAGANVNVTDKRGQTPLQIAVASIIEREKESFYLKYLSNVYRQYGKYDPVALSQENATKCTMSLVQGGANLDKVWEKFSVLFPHPEGITFEQMVLCEVLIQSYGFQSITKKKLQAFVTHLISLKEHGLLKLIYTAGVDPTWDDQSALGISADESDREMFKWVKTLRSSPRTLKDMCRQTIRRLLSPNVLFYVEKVPILSPEVKDYVCIMDTEHYSVPS